MRPRNNRAASTTALVPCRRRTARALAARRPLLAQRTIAPRVAAGMAGQTSGFLRLVGPMPRHCAITSSRSRYRPIGCGHWTPPRRRRWPACRCIEAAWFFPGGGWVSLAALADPLLKAGASICAPASRCNGSLRPTAAGSCWRRRPRIIVQADAVVLANGAADALRLLEPFGYQAPLSRRRGQVSWWPGSGSSLARWPLAGDGYALPHPEAPAVRRHRHGRRRRAGLAGDRPRGQSGPAGAADRSAGPTRRPWQGRVGWRLRAEDRLPLAGGTAGVEGESFAPLAAPGRAAPVHGPGRSRHHAVCRWWGGWWRRASPPRRCRS